jgi:hypothetical protein
MGLSVVFHLLFSHFGVYGWDLLIFSTRDFLISTTFAIALVASLPQLAKKRILDTIPLAIQLIIGFYLAFTLVDFILNITF